MPLELTNPDGKRNRVATSERITTALDDILGQEGLDGVGINAIAEKAGVSKVLIYRYFGSLEGLLDHYIKRGNLIPNYTPALLDQIQPVDQYDLARVWSTQSLQLFRRFRASRAARELLKATVKESNDLVNAISQGQDAELTRLVDQLSFLKGADYKATSAIILGALSYLTIQAQLDRSVLGINLRDEINWQRIEKAVTVIFKALNQAVIDSPTTRLNINANDIPPNTW